MDLRVLAAVFLTLFAIGIGMAEGAVDMQELRDAADRLRGAGDISDILAQAGAGAPNTTVEGAITSPDTVELRIQSPARLELSVGPAADVVAGDSTLRTSRNTTLTVEGFRGTVHLAPTNLTVQGSMMHLSTPSLNLSYDAPTDVSARSPAPRITVQGLEEQTFKFSNATGTVTAGETTVQVDQEKAWFLGFTGNLSATGGRYQLGGRLRSAVIGGAEIG